MTDVMEKRACACGCGYIPSGTDAYVAGHSPRARKPAARCACGCGMPTPRRGVDYYRGHAPGRDPAEFWAMSSPGTNGCRTWDGLAYEKGYGRISWNGKQWSTHRLAWALTHGDPGDQWVLHRCDNPPCVNPEHLFLGDHEVNTADKVAKDRQVAGHDHGRARLTTEQIAEIRRRYVPSSGAGRPDGNKDDLAREFGIHPKYVYRIWRGENRSKS